MKFLHYHKKSRCSKAGFSIFELLIVIAVVSVITGAALISYNRSSSQTVLSNFAYDIALTVRQAQVFGISVKEAGTGVGDFPYYGIHVGTLPASTMVLFADRDRDGVYDGALEDFKVYNFGVGYTISAMCGTYSSTCDSLTGLDISFVRPNPDAILNGTPAPSGPYSSVTLTVRNPHSVTRMINVYANGQIAVTDL